MDQAQRIAVQHVIGPKEGKDPAVTSVSLRFRDSEPMPFFSLSRAPKHPSSSWKGFEKDRQGKFVLYSTACEDEALNKLFFFSFFSI